MERSEAFAAGGGADKLSKNVTQRDAGKHIGIVAVAVSALTSGLSDLWKVNLGGTIGQGSSQRTILAAQ